MCCGNAPIWPSPAPSGGRACPVEVNHEPYLTLGIHIGARTTSIVATDLFGRTLDVVETPTPRGPQAAALASLAASARRYLSRWHRRRALWVGVAAGGVVDSATGYLDHPRLGWSDAPVGPVLAEALGLPVSVASHVDAMAGAELLLGVRRLPVSEIAGATPTSASTSLYVYARETVGYALSIGGRVHSPSSGPGTIAALPADSELLGGTGQLESTVSDEAVLIAARKARIITGDGPASTMPAVLRAARQGNEQAQALLAERARVLGQAVALLRDMLNPDDLVVGGQAFTEYPEGMELVEAAYHGTVGDAAASDQGDGLRQPGAGGRCRRGVPRRALCRSDRRDEAGAEPPTRGECVDRTAPAPRCRHDCVRPATDLSRSNAGLAVPRRVAVLSVHTSPLAQPGTGDAGGMNVYVLQSALQMARRGVEVEIFTRATSSADAPVVQVAPGVLVRNVVAGPFEGLDKYDLPTQLCAFTAGVLRAEATHEPGYYDIVHSHYWLSGQVGWLARDRWAVPLVHTAHTLAAVKNAALADGDSPEPPLRAVGEQQVVDEADRSDRQHRNRSAATCFASSCRSGRASTSSTPASTLNCSRPATAPPPAPLSG